MKRVRPRASGPQTLRAYLTPERCWELPLDHAGVQDPQALLDEGFADPRADERMAVRFIVGASGRIHGPRGACRCRPAAGRTVLVAG